MEQVLSIEEKARLYDEAIGKARDYHIVDTDNTMQVKARGTMEYLFPVLKESEDEATWLKKYLEEEISCLSIDIRDTDDRIKLENLKRSLAWLEKQKVTASNEDIEKMRNAAINACKYMVDNFENSTKQYEDAIAWLEKQGEHKQGISEQKLNTILDEEEYMAKFKVGDWVVQENIGTYKIVEVCDSWYEVIDNQNNHYSIGFDQEYMCHLWTIDDAKDGDVLACYKEILLFKSSYSVQDRRISLYCWYNGQTDNFHNKEVKGVLLTTKYKVYPATEEQRALLFSKMYEAGYEWDSEKKELRKIEQTPVEWNEKDMGYIDDLIAHFSQNEKLENTKEDIIVWLKSLKNRYTSQLNKEWSEEDVKLKKIKQEPLIEGSFVNVDEVREDFMQEVYRVLDTDPTNDRANQIIDAFDNLPTVTIQVAEWDEEDENMLAAVIADIQSAKVVYESEVDWLKSLRDRVQPKHEWKQENTYDLTDFENAMMHIGGSFFGENAGLDPNDTNAIKEQANLLLELVPKQEWSKEDDYLRNETIQHLEELIRIIQKWGKVYSDEIQYYQRNIDWLKSLKPQPKQEWSEEAMKYLKENHSPSEVSDFQAAMNIAVAKAYDKGRADAIAEMSIWSEKDENMLAAVIADIQSAKVVYESEVDWLKSLKDRVNSQSTAYYNPYKEVVESIAEMCKHYDRLDVGSLQDFYDNVKVKCKDAKEYESLFPQNRWKPSEEIMKGLNEIINKLAISPVIHEHGYLYDLMVNLRKKLKGE